MLLKTLLQNQSDSNRFEYAGKLASALNNRIWYHPKTGECYSGTFRTNASTVANLMNELTNESYSYLTFYSDPSTNEVVHDLKALGFVESLVIQ